MLPYKEKDPYRHDYGEIILNLFYNKKHSPKYINKQNDQVMNIIYSGLIFFKGRCL